MPAEKIKNAFQSEEDKYNIELESFVYSVSGEFWRIAEDEHLSLDDISQKTKLPLKKIKQFMSGDFSMSIDDIIKMAFGLGYVCNFELRKREKS